MKDWKIEYNNLNQLYCALRDKHNAYVKTFDFTRCWLCGTTDNLTEHHLELKRKRKMALRTIPLCRDCHSDVEELRRDGQVKKLMRQAYNNGYEKGVNLPCIHIKEKK